MPSLGVASLGTICLILMLGERPAGRVATGVCRTVPKEFAGSLKSLPPRSRTVPTFELMRTDLPASVRGDAVWVADRKFKLLSLPCAPGGGGGGGGGGASEYPTEPEFVGAPPSAGDAVELGAGAPAPAPDGAPGFPSGDDPKFGAAAGPALAGRPVEGEARPLVVRIVGTAAIAGSTFFGLNNAKPCKFVPLTSMSLRPPQASPSAWQSAKRKR